MSTRDWHKTTDGRWSSTWLASGATEQTILTAIAHAPLQFAPGTQYQYSNSNYFVLGAIIAAVSAESYSEYLATKITGPLALSHTSNVFEPPAAALPYFSYGQGDLPAPSAKTAAGGLWSTVLDLASFDAALFGGRVVPAAQFAEMVRPPGGSEYGMGLIYYGEQLGAPFVWHSGNGAGFNTVNGFFLENGFSISLVTNANPNAGADQFTSFAFEVLSNICSGLVGTTPVPCPLH